MIEESNWCIMKYYCLTYQQHLILLIIIFFSNFLNPTFMSKEVLCSFLGPTWLDELSVSQFPEYNLSLLSFCMASPRVQFWAQSSSAFTPYLLEQYCDSMISNTMCMQMIHSFILHLTCIMIPIPLFLNCVQLLWMSDYGWNLISSKLMMTKLNLLSYHPVITINLPSCNFRLGGLHQPISDSKEPRCHIW